MTHESGKQQIFHISDRKITALLLEFRRKGQPKLPFAVAAAAAAKLFDINGLKRLCF